MEIRSYNNELANASLLFSRLFRNIVIERKIGNTIKEIPVTCVIGNRSRIFKNLENREKRAEYKLPMIAISRSSITINNERKSNLHNEVKYQTNSNTRNYNLMTPVPVDIGFTVTILSKNPADQDMIMSNFLPFFNSDLYVTSIHPKFTNVKYNSQVVMDTSISEEHLEEIDGSADDIITNTFTFIFKTYIFGGTDKVEAGLRTVTVSSYISGETSGIISTDVIYDGFVPIIKNINLNVHAVPYLDVVDTTPHQYVTSSITKLSTWTDIETSAIQSCYVTLSFDVLASGFDKNKEYSIMKYFSDMGTETTISNDFYYYNSKLPNPYPLEFPDGTLSSLNHHYNYDVLRYRLDDDGVTRMT